MSYTFRNSKNQENEKVILKSIKVRKYNNMKTQKYKNKEQRVEDK